jgi:hypothetical protein
MEDNCMKRIWLTVAVVIVCLPATLFGQGFFPGVPSSLVSLTENVKVNPYAQVGFQWMGSNLNLPVQNEPLALPLNIGPMDISLQDGNFWTGIAGINILISDKYSVFGAAGGLLNRPFITSGTIPVSLGGLGTSATVQFTNTQVESWFIQTGVGLGPVLFGLYWNHFAYVLGEARNPAGPLQPNPTLGGDILTKTFAPFIGLAIPAGGLTATVTYSPFAYSNTALSLKSTQTALTQLRYTWQKPGDMVNVLLQYNTPVSSTVSFGLWCNYSWMRMCQDAELEFENAPFPAISRTRDVTATMTQYVAGGGVTLGINF